MPTIHKYLITFLMGAIVGTMVSQEIVKEVPDEQMFRVSTLLDAIEYVESKGDVNAIGDKGQAVGCMQIHPIMVKDVNRILRRTEYTLNDRYDREKSHQMCTTYLNHYCKNMKPEDAAACWVAGPDGYLQKDNPIVKKYIEKIKSYLDNLQ